MSLFTSFNAGVSGLRNAQSGLNTTAHNLANTKTLGYSRQQNLNTDTYYKNISLTSSGLQQTGYGTTVSSIRQIRDEFLDAQYRVETGRQSFYEVHVITEQEIEDILGEMEGVEFQEALQDIWDTAETLSTNPESITTRELFLAQAETFLEKAMNVHLSLRDYQINLNSQIEKQVETINTLADKIAQMNTQIAKYEASGTENANDYRDTRNYLLDELSKYTAFESYEDYTGQVVVRINNVPLIDQSRVNHMACEKIDFYEYNTETEEYEQAESSPMYTVVWETGGTGEVYSTDKQFRKNNDSEEDESEEDFEVESTINKDFKADDVSDRGSLPGILTARGERFGYWSDILQSVEKTPRGMEELNKYNNTTGNCLIQRVEAQFDLLVHRIVTTVNDAFCPNVEIDASGLGITDWNGNDVETAKVLDINRCPVGTDDNNTPGTEIFSRRATERYTVMEVDGPVYITDIDGNEINVAKYNEENDTYELYVYNEEYANDVNSLYTLQNLIMNGTLKANYSYLPVHGNPELGKEEEYDWSGFTNLFEAWKEESTMLDPNALTRYGVDRYYEAMVGALGTQGFVWSGILKSQTTLTEGIEDKRQQVAGVSTEEEMISLLMYQHAYNASSRYITTIDSMLEHIIMRLG